MAKRINEFDWHDLKYFLAVARSRTVRGAAEQMGANHVTVSRRLTALEDALDARLFDRSREGLSLTQLGEDLLPKAEAVEDSISSASRIIAGQDENPTGQIFVSIAPFLLSSSIAQDLARFGRKYPEIDIHLDVSNNYANLDRREADVSIRYAYEVTGDLLGRVLAHSKVAAYCSPDYAGKVRDNGGTDLHWLGWNEPVLATTADWINQSDYPNATLRHRSMDLLTHLAFARENVGLATLPCFIGDITDGLVRAPFQTPKPGRKLWLLLHPDLRKTARIRLFVDYLAACIKSRKAEYETVD